MKLILIFLLLNAFMLQQIAARSRRCRPLICRKCDQYLKSRIRRSATTRLVFAHETRMIGLNASEIKAVKAELEFVSDIEHITKNNEVGEEDNSDRNGDLLEIDHIDDDPELRVSGSRKVNKRSSSNLRRRCLYHLSKPCCKRIMQTTFYLGYKV